MQPYLDPLSAQKLLIVRLFPTRGVLQGWNINEHYIVPVTDRFEPAPRINQRNVGVGLHVSRKYLQGGNVSPRSLLDNLIRCTNPNSVVSTKCRCVPNKSNRSAYGMLWWRLFKCGRHYVPLLGCRLLWIIRNSIKTVTTECETNLNDGATYVADTLADVVLHVLCKQYNLKQAGNGRIDTHSSKHSSNNCTK